MEDTLLSTDMSTGPIHLDTPLSEREAGSRRQRENKRETERQRHRERMRERDEQRQRERSDGCGRGVGGGTDRFTTAKNPQRRRQTSTT